LLGSGRNLRSLCDTFGHSRRIFSRKADGEFRQCVAGEELAGLVNLATGWLLRDDRLFAESGWKAFSVVCPFFR
jgi:hypothetical protein